MSRPTGLVAIVAAATVLAAVAVSAAASSAPVTYTAKVFMQGMTLTLPDAGWTVSDDKAGVLVINAPRGPLSGARLIFNLDPYPLAPNGHAAPVSNVGHTATALIDWLHHNPNFVASAPVTRRIAEGVAATSIDLEVVASAPREDPHCTSACITWLSIVRHGPGPHYGFQYGTGHGEPVRLYLATLGKGTAAHVLMIAVDTPSHAAFTAVVGTAQKILGGAKLPATVTAG
jgi:hypothetical protein